MNTQIAIHRIIDPPQQDHTQIALIEDQQVVEIDMEPTTGMRIGDIYYAKVVRILSALRMAFVEIGEKRTALLHFAQVPLPREKGHTDVAQFLRVGHYLPVQIVKLPRGEKGAVVSAFIQIVGALLIYHPDQQGLHLSQRITDEQEQQRLRALNFNHVMMRSLAENQSAENLQTEYQRLQTEWEKINAQIEKTKTPTLLRAEFPLAQCYLRDRIANVSVIHVDNEALFLQLQTFMQTWLSPWANALQYKPGKHSLWHMHKIDNIIHQASAKKINLPSSGFIVVEQTEALISVDVNTGPSVKAPTGIDIIVQTNSEAARAVAHHLRLCNLAGIIVVDFISMKDPEQQQTVLTLLNQALSRDPAYTTLHGFSPLGLVEISRQRRGNSWVS